MNLEQQILESYQRVMSSLPEVGQLRFGRKTVRISDIAKQYYCEKSVELSYLKPKPATPRMADGEKGHAAISSTAEPMTVYESVKQATLPREKPFCLYEFNIAWLSKDVPITGNVDEAWFKQGNVDLVVERKFTNTLAVYNPYQVQAQLYCLGLGEMGFDVRGTKYRIALMKRSCFDCGELLTLSCPTISCEADEYSCQNGASRAFIFPFEKIQAVNDLDVVNQRNGTLFKPNTFR
jgi:hypothetical protein